jgi:hypothetical protein
VGHSVIKVRAALAPIHVIGNEEWAARSGISLRDCFLKARQNDKEIVRWRDDLLFTHHGISGPTALGISRVIAEAAGFGAITLEVDVLPDSSFEQAGAALREWAGDNPRKQWGSYLVELIPERLVAWFLQSAEISPELAVNATDKKAKNRLIATLKGWQLGQVRDVPIEKGEVVAGGVALDEVDPHTMRSLKVDRLYLCGEVLDIAGPLGGYNLQAAFSTGYAAGESAANLK